MNERIEHIDIAKGISIALVAMYHSNLREVLPVLIESMSLFRMPLFFFLSGLFFSYSIKPGLFIRKKAEALLKPYFSILLLLLLFSFLLNEENILRQLKYILYSNGTNLKWLPMWFLTHLFAVYIFSYILFRYFYFHKFTFSMKVVCLFFFLIIGTLNIDILWNTNLTVFGYMVNLPGLPFSTDIILTTSAFFITGYLLKEHIVNFSPNRNLFFVSIIIYLCVIFFTDSYISLILRIYSNPVFATIAAICGIYIIMCLSYSLAKSTIMKRIFISLGQASLFILIFHLYLIEKTHLIFEGYISGDNSTVLLSIIAFMLSIFLPLGIKWTVNQNSFLALFFLPFKSNRLLNRVR